LKQSSGARKLSSLEGKMSKQYVVNAFWDDEAKVWVADSEDIPGLATEAPTLDALVKRVDAVAPELLEDNAHLVQGARSDEEKISFQIISELHTTNAA
jgi:predicted RNase H-like HicB family nuclease